MVRRHLAFETHHRGWYLHLPPRPSGQVEEAVDASPQAIPETRLAAGQWALGCVLPPLWDPDSVMHGQIPGMVEIHGWGGDDCK